MRLIRYCGTDTIFFDFFAPRALGGYVGHTNSGSLYVMFHRPSSCARRPFSYSYGSGKLPILGCQYIRRVDDALFTQSAVCQRSARPPPPAAQARHVVGFIVLALADPDQNMIYRCRRYWRKKAPRRINPPDHLLQPAMYSFPAHRHALSIWCAAHAFLRRITDHGIRWPSNVLW